YLRFNLCSTPFGIIGILTLTIPATITLNFSAQRLSASSEFSLSGNYDSALRALVLNAFRHHRNSHVSRSIVSAATASAQRLSASSEFSLFESLLCSLRKVSCSTPFGIIGILTSVPTKSRKELKRAQRLSASS